MKFVATLSALVALLWSCSVGAEVVLVKYQGAVDLAHPAAAFRCQDTKSSLVWRVCYSAPARYMVINLKGTYYHYCGIGQNAVAALLASDSLGRSYNQQIKGRFDCRLAQVPNFAPRGK